MLQQAIANALPSALLQLLAVPSEHLPSHTYQPLQLLVSQMRAADKFMCSCVYEGGFIVEDLPGEVRRQ